MITFSKTIRAALGCTLLVALPAMAEDTIKIGMITDKVGPAKPYAEPVSAGVTFAVPKQTEIKIAGADKQAVGEIAAKIRRIRPPEPYKGKGVRYAGEKVRRKEGKKK